MADTAVRSVHDVAVASIPGKTCSILLVADFLELFLAAIYGLPNSSCILVTFPTSQVLCLVPSVSIYLLLGCPPR